MPDVFFNTAESIIFMFYTYRAICAKKSRWIDQSPKSMQKAGIYYHSALSINLLLLMSMGISMSAKAQQSNPVFMEAPAVASKWIAPQVATELTAEVMITAHSPAQPIAAFIKEWDAPLESGKHAYTQGRMAVEVRPADSAVSYGLNWRYDYMMRFNQETANLYWQYKNSQIPNKDQVYPIYLEAKHNERIGANIGFTQQIIPNWQLSAYANFWKGLHALEGDAVGTLTSQAALEGKTIRNIDRLNSIKTDLNYYYDEPALGEEDLNWYPDKPAGYGYSVDIKLAGQITDKTALMIRGYDVLGRMHWQDMPSTEYILDYDVNRRPNNETRGQLDTNNVIQTLPWRVEGSLTHQLTNKWQLGTHAQANDIETLYQLSAGYQLDNAFLPMPIVITGLIEPQTQALGLAIDSKYGGVKFLTDDIDAEKAKRSEISLYGRYSW